MHNQYNKASHNVLGEVISVSYTNRAVYDHIGEFRLLRMEIQTRDITLIVSHLGHNNTPE